ncbi:Sir2 family NAD-dependent protein deacetylase [Candidatus Dependentiae bacterium]
MKKLFFTLLFTISKLFCSTPYNLLSAPQKISSKDVEKASLKADFSFNFNFGDGNSLEAFYECGKTGFAFNICKEVFDKLEIPIQKDLKFDGKTNTYFYSYNRQKRDKSKETAKCKEQETKICKPLEKLHPEKATEISIRECVRILKTQKVIFYTGAGISAEYLPDMKGIYEALSFHKAPQDKNKAPKTEFLIREAVKNPKNYIEPMHKIFTDFLNAKPTKAHIALKNIALKFECAVLTENMDFMHLKTGIDVPMIKPEKMLQEVTPATLKKIDAIVCIGMSADDRGFLAWYKKHNPKGKFVAVNLEKPEFLDKGDMALLGDVQVVLPKIEKLI